jgi:hypothetical protein
LYVTFGILRFIVSPVLPILSVEPVTPPIVALLSKNKSVPAERIISLS